MFPARFGHATFSTRFDRSTRTAHVIFTAEGNVHDVFGSIALEIQRVARTGLGALGINADNVEGYIGATNVAGDGRIAPTLNYVDPVAFRQIDGELIEDMLDNVVNSNDEIHINDLEFSFRVPLFLDDMLQGAVGRMVPRAIALGRSRGAGRARIPKWWPGGKFLKTWTSVPEDVNCAAFALCYLMWNDVRQYRKGNGRDVRDAKELMVKLGWGTVVEVGDVKDFVREFPDYLVAVLTYDSLRRPSSFVTVGSEFADDDKHSKILYLIYDPVQQHFAAHPNIQSVLRKKFTEYWMWCYACHSGYVTASGHECLSAEGHRAKRLKVIQKCTACGEIGYYSV